MLALLAANLLLACGPWLVRLAKSESEVGPVAAGFWRLTLALPVLIVILARGREPLRPGWTAALPLVLIGGLAFAADLGAWHLGIVHTRLGNATLFGNVSAFLFPLYGFLVARAWPRPRQAGALLLAAAGAMLLLGRSYELSADNVLGDMLCIVAGVFYTLYLIAIGRAHGRIGPLATLAVSAAAGMPVLLVLALALGEAIMPADWAPLVALALFSQLLGQGLVLWALSQVKPLVVGLMTLTQPIVSAAIGWVAYGERLAAPDLIGAVAIVVAMLLVRDEMKPKPLSRAEPVVHGPA